MLELVRFAVRAAVPGGYLPPGIVSLTQLGAHVPAQCKSPPVNDLQRYPACAHTERAHRMLLHRNLASIRCLRILRYIALGSTIPPS